MGFTKEKTVTVSAKDFLWKDPVCYAEFEHDGRHYLIQAAQDRDVDCPREEHDHAWTWTTTKGAGYSDRGAIPLDDWEEMEEEEKKKYLYYPLSLLRHSGDTVYVGAKAHWSDPGGWDSGCMGVAYITKQDALLEWGGEGATRLTAKIREAAHKCLQAEVEELNLFLGGYVYGISVTLLETEEQESCWGYYCADTAEIARCMREYLPDGMTEEEMDSALAGLEWNW
jgi:hypothetical protein